MSEQTATIQAAFLTTLKYSRVQRMPVAAQVLKGDQLLEVQIADLAGKARVEAIFKQVHPSQTYKSWAMARGFNSRTVSAVFAMTRREGYECDLIRRRLAEEAGLPVDKVFVF